MATALGGSEIAVPVHEVNPTATILLETSYHWATLVGPFRFPTNKSLLYLPTSRKRGRGADFK